ncbi:unnamed protein product [Schistosoma turkestanicum]|nr:unnamed protein product [Schistosoma turkestanicum]
MFFVYTQLGQDVFDFFYCNYLALIGLGVFLLVIRSSFVPVLLGEIATSGGCLYNWIHRRFKWEVHSTFNNGVDAAVDHIQQKFKCCGSRSYRDWTDSVFQNHSKLNEIFPYPEYSLVVPDSCCVRSVKSCGTLPHPSNVYNEGCMESILLNLREQYYIICVVALALVSVEFFGVILACCYSKAPKMSH